MSPKDSFWTGLQGGLLDRKHYLKMGMSIWLFGYLTRSQTALNKAGEGVVNYGHPLTLEQISDDLKGISVRTVRLWAARLRREGYIRTEEHGHDGLTFWIAKAKQKTKQPKFANQTGTLADASEVERDISPRHNSVGKEISPRHISVREQEPPRHPIVPIQNENPAQALSHVQLAAVCDSPTPKGSTSKNLSYYNKDAAAQTAAVECASLKELAKAKTMPKGQSPRELDARRRELLQQAERIKRKYPAKESGPGRAVEMPPQEATA